MTVAVNHVGVSVRSLDAARGFWVEGLGAAVHGQFGWPTGTAPADESLATVGTAAEVLLLRTDAAFMELFEFSSPTPSPRAHDAPGVRALTWAVEDVAATAARAAEHGGQVSEEADYRVFCPDGTPVRLVAADGGPTGLLGVEVAVADPESFGWEANAGEVRLEVTGGAVAAPAAAVDLGVNHLCLDVSDIESARAGGSPRTTWHHPVTESSGGIAAVCYGTTHDGVLLELLESRSEEAFFSRARLPHP